jgi:hypothetical protein
MDSALGVTAPDDAALGRFYGFSFIKLWLYDGDDGDSF